ncbi:MAG TPA: four helix bundle protein [Bacteroidales bacterium]|nr:four helix bundle protein [Bacteroidales bacterium]HRZ48248.1 four helix bundle protein [Bacteroidales bacterium]
MAIQKFEDMIAWQKAQDLAFDIYQGFGDCRDYGFRDQLLRAAVSVSNNLAEGFERGSRIDFKRFVFISKGSVSEIKSMLYLAQRLGYLHADKSRKLMEQTDEIRRILSGLITSLAK